MLFQRISRANPEKVFIVCKNGYGTAALTNGQPVMWDLGDADGVNVTQPSAAFKRGSAFAGIVAETIAVSSYGLVQVYGHHTAVNVDASTSADIYTGAPLFMSVAAFNLEGPYIGSGSTAGVHLDDRQVACALEAYTLVGTTGTIKAQIFAL